MGQPCGDITWIIFKKFRCKLTLMETMRRNTVAEDIELDRIQVKFVFVNLLL